MKHPLNLVIPTRGRVGSLTTVKGLPKIWLKRTIIVCPSDEVRSHKNEFPLVKVIAQKDDEFTIAQKRAWIFKWCHARKIEKILMMDDDLYFNHRIRADISRLSGYGPHSRQYWNAYLKKNPSAASLKTCEHDDPDLRAMFFKVERMLEDFHHGGIGARQGNNGMPGEWEKNSRAMYALAYRVSTVMRECKLGRIDNREDFDYTLQLLMAGYENCIYTWGAVSHAAGFANKQGGVAEQRTIKQANRDAEKLASWFPDVVTVKAKEYKSSVPRKEVIIQWKKAAIMGMLI